MFEDIDYEGFKDYCKQTLSKNTVQQYQTYLRNFISFLEDNKIYSIFDYYDAKSKNPKYLEEEFLKSGKTKKPFADYNSAVNKYIEFKKGKGETMPTTSNEIQKKQANFSLNQILYGPPGTGKTYTTIAKAIEIIELRRVEKEEIKDEEKRKALKKQFDEYVQSGQIKFVTFHQSYGYEEFVEGLKAYTEDKNIHYRVEDGIFKEICKRIKECKEHKKWKVPQISEDRFDKLYDIYAANLPNYAKNETSNKKLKTSDGYEFYLYKNTAQGIEARSASSADGNPMPMSKDSLKKILFDQDNSKSSYRYGTHPDAILEDMLSTIPYVLIIDEINRGNISKIFGELITLIEPSKRLGADDELMVELPYSQHKREEEKEKFGVPSNLYIIGTMNTADRSIALMDTALRRRFEFVEMMPEYDELNKINIEDINIGEMLKTINERIEYLYDRDHTIGHAYFLGVSNMSSLENVFKNKILPLLQEYFYDDWEKIRLVLGDNQKEKTNETNSDDKQENNKTQFITKNKKRASELFGGKIEDIDDKVLYEINFKAFSDPQSYKEIYNQANKDETKTDNAN
jgi:GTPase subunit of restriction endonuclease